MIIFKSSSVFLLCCLNFTDRNELEAAETYLDHAAVTNFTTFIKMLSDVLVAGGNSQVARMAAGLQLKNHLTSKDPTLKQQYQQRWLALPEDIRLYIKKNVCYFYQNHSHLCLMK